MTSNTNGSIATMGDDGPVSDDTQPFDIISELASGRHSKAATNYSEVILPPAA